MRGHHLLIVGAGPKAIATAAKAQVLAELGFTVPRITIVEKYDVGAHWSGRHGFTTGHLRLGTSPLKDLGFPYATHTGLGTKVDSEINRRMASFSWLSHLQELGKVAQWVDRGSPCPTHYEWSEYLQWAASKLLPPIEILRGEVTQVSLCERAWKTVVASDSGTQRIIAAHGLMFTGPGEMTARWSGLSHPRVHSVHEAIGQLPELIGRMGRRIVFVGAGESTLAALVTLARQRPRELEVAVIVPHGTILSRGEGHLENAVYSEPERSNWARLSERDRLRFIRHTDQGVFSIAAQRELDENFQFNIVAGRVRDFHAGQTSVELEIEYRDQVTPLAADGVFFATGMNPWSQVERMLTPLGQEAIKHKLGVRQVTNGELRARIDTDLSVSGLSPKLYLPMLAGLTQGPGFPNLSCLGKLSDRVLFPFLNASLASRRNESHEMSEEGERPWRTVMSVN